MTSSISKSDKAVRQNKQNNQQTTIFLPKNMLSRKKVYLFRKMVENAKKLSKSYLPTLQLPDYTIFYPLLTGLKK